MHSQTQHHCHNSEQQAANAAHAHHGHAGGSNLRMAASATLHCLTGCAIGEFAGLAIGVSLGLGAWPTMLLATVLAYISGYTLGLVPLVRSGHSWGQAWRLIWLGETVSIAVMEVAMNFTDYHVGGVTAASVFSWPFWLGFAAAVPAGFVAALPVNWWLLKRNLKSCH